jgi:hypothetical protein
METTRRQLADAKNPKPGRRTTTMKKLTSVLAFDRGGLIPLAVLASLLFLSLI